MFQAIRNALESILRPRVIDSIAVTVSRADEAKLRQLWSGYAKTYGPDSIQAKRIQRALIARRQARRAISADSTAR